LRWCFYTISQQIKENEVAKILIALVYLAGVLVIGIFSSRKIKTAESFATADKKIPFWTNVYSMASAQIGAGATLGVASMAYAYGISGFSLGIGAALGAVLSGLIFAKKIRESNVTTIPELIRKNLGNKVAAVMSILTLFVLFSILAAQIRSLGTILQIFIPSLSLPVACIFMSAIMIIYAAMGGMVASVRTDKINISIMIISVMVLTPIIALRQAGGFAGIVSNIDPKYLHPATMGIVPMVSMMAYFGLQGMVNNENFLRICGAKSAGEARAATLTSALLIYLPYMLFCSVIGLAGVVLIKNLGTSDSIIPAMINQTTGDALGAFLLAALLAAVMGTAASIAMITAVTFSRDVVKRLKTDLDDKGTLYVQRVSLVGFTVLGIIVAIFGGSIVGIMEDVGAPCTAALIPLFCGIFFWKKLNSTSAMITIVVALFATLTWWALGAPWISHFLFGLICSTVTMIIASLITSKKGGIQHVSNT
jgi:Na+/proline symporter